MTKGNILMIENTHHGIGGHDTVILNLCKGLDKLGYKTAIGAFHFKVDLPDYIIKIELKKTSLLHNTINGFSFDLIHSHESFMNYYTLLNKKPMIYHFHGPNGILQAINFRLSMAVCQNRISKLITVSRSSLTYLKGKTGKIPIDVVYNGVETDFFNVNLPSSFKQGSPQLLFVGNLLPSKNVETIIKAMPYVIQYYPNAHLQIIGDGPDYKKLKQLIHDFRLHKHVELIGKLYKKDILPYYSSCDIFISASVAEQHSITAFEAMACGKPVILSNIPPFREVISNSNTGLTFSSYDSKDLSNKIIQLYDNLLFYAKNTRKWSEEFSWDSSCLQISKIYEKLFN